VFHALALLQNVPEKCIIFSQILYLHVIVLCDFRHILILLNSHLNTSLGLLKLNFTVFTKIFLLASDRSTALFIISEKMEVDGAHCEQLKTDALPYSEAVGIRSQNFIMTICKVSVIRLCEPW
jgi:hypothetical protein